MTITFRAGPTFTLLFLFANTLAFAVSVWSGLWLATYANLAAAALHLANLRHDLLAGRGSVEGGEA